MAVTLPFLRRLKCRILEPGKWPEANGARAIEWPRVSQLPRFRSPVTCALAARAALVCATCATGQPATVIRRRRPRAPEYKPLGQHLDLALSDCSLIAHGNSGHPPG